MSTNVTVNQIDFAGKPAFEFQGSSGDDKITGFNGQRNLLFGNDGNDILRSGKDTPLMSLDGGAGNDTLFGSLTADRLGGGSGADHMFGGPGDDIYEVDDPGDIIFERERWEPTGFGDSVSATIDYSIVSTAVEVLTLNGDARIGTGNHLNNRITGGDGNHILDGGRGIDILTGGYGDDTYILRHQDDTAEEIGNNARQKTASAEAGGHDTVLAHNSYKLMLGIEDIILQDIIGKTGQAVNGLTAIGNNLDNLVQGNATDNSLNGRTGNDTLTGGDGADSFIFTDALGAQHADMITDFTSGEDRIVIKSGLVNLGSGTLDTDSFHLGAETLTADHRFLFDGDTLRYDADGSGTGAAVDVAYFDGTPTLTVDDIFIA